MPSHLPADRLRVLIIEDHADSAESMRLLLEILGHEVEVAHAGAQGVECASERPPRVVLCDIGLPGEMDGYAVAAALRSRPALDETILVALTGYGQEEDRQRALEAGFNLHLTKPVDPDALEQLLSSLA